MAGKRAAENDSNPPSPRRQRRGNGAGSSTDQDQAGAVYASAQVETIKAPRLKSMARMDIATYLNKYAIYVRLINSQGINMHAQGIMEGLDVEDRMYIEDRLGMERLTLTHENAKVWMESKLQTLDSRDEHEMQEELKRLRMNLKIKDTDARCAQYIKDYRRIERSFGIADAIENVQKLALEHLVAGILPDRLKETVRTSMKMLPKTEKNIVKFTDLLLREARIQQMIFDRSQPTQKLKPQVQSKMKQTHGGLVRKPEEKKEQKELKDRNGKLIECSICKKNHLWRRCPTATEVQKKELAEKWRPKRLHALVICNG